MPNGFHIRLSNMASFPLRPYGCGGGSGGEMRLYTVQSHVEIMKIRTFKKFASSPQEAIEMVRKEPDSFIGDKHITEKVNWVEIASTSEQPSPIFTTPASAEKE